MLARTKKTCLESTNIFSHCNSQLARTVKNTLVIIWISYCMQTENSIFLEGRTKYREQYVTSGNALWSNTFTKYAKFTMQCAVQNIEALHALQYIFCKNCNYIQCQAVFSKNRERIWHSIFLKNLSITITSITLTTWFLKFSSVAVLSILTYGRPLPGGGWEEPHQPSTPGTNSLFL